MSYQVLARKWRPRGFTEMVGQEHVLRALINGLDNDRLHHAYLFTGTRGVGKTTLARILAKCLNCDTGVSSTPCNECGSCREIAEGRFVDLIEVDAASRTKVEDTRELLDNVQYAPTRGRYKVYLIDEVHMLSTHSFNALLKTLEEPPPHVKFLLATTDPQKLPVTILSRCLQFNLKNLSPERIVGHLKHILAEEKIPFEESALWELGRSADGSMRDALSLTDQAIAHGGGTLTTAEVNAMLGTIDSTSVVEICQAVAQGNSPTAMELVEHMAEHAPDYSAALADMLSIWHQAAIAQAVPDALDAVHEHHHEVLALAEQVSREDIQLFYQITLMGRKDLPYAADPRSGFEMVLLRLIAFRPVTSDQSVLPDQSGGVSRPGASSVGEAGSPAKKPETVAPAGVNSQTAAARTAREVSPIESATPGTPDESSDESTPPGETRTRVDAKTAPVKPTNVTPIRPGVSPDGVVPCEPNAAVPDIAEPPNGRSGGGQDDYESYLCVSDGKESRQTPPVAAQKDTPSDSPTEGRGQGITAAVASIPFNRLSSANWNSVCENLGLGGLLLNTAMNLVLKSIEDNRVQFDLDRENSALYDESQEQRLGEALSAYFDRDISASIQVAAIAQESPRMIADRLKAERLRQAIDSLHADPHVRELTQVFGAELVESSVKPND